MNADCPEVMSSTTSDEPMVSIHGVKKNYGAVSALKMIDLEVRRGEFLTLLGPSGSGKTTLLNLIAGMATPSQGRIIIDGRDVTFVIPQKRNVGMVFQNYALMPHMTIFDNIAFPLQVRGMPKSDIRGRVHDVLELVHLPEVVNRKPKELSGGQQQRVAIARCIVYNPKLILMDEPLGALDKKLREQMQLEIKRLQADLGITMIYVTHDQEEALNLSDRIVLLNEGGVEQLGTPDDLYSRPASQFVATFIGQSSLLDCEVIESGPWLVLRLANGVSCRVTGRDALLGTRGKLVLRPEALHLSHDAVAPAGCNILRITIEDRLATGGIVKYYGIIDGGEQVVVQELNNRRNAKITPAIGEVYVTWPAESGVFLER